MKTENRKLRRLGFTLVELLTVLGIIAILMAILIPTLSSSREKGRIAYCANNLTQLGRALALGAAFLGRLGGRGLGAARAHPLKGVQRQAHGLPSSGARWVDVPNRVVGG